MCDCSDDIRQMSALTIFEFIVLTGVHFSVTAPRGRRQSIFLGHYASAM